ncbi:ASPH, partial [Symbiodinium sp. KB8]
MVGGGPAGADLRTRKRSPVLTARMCERQPLRAQSADNQDVANLADSNEQVNNEEAKGIDSMGQDLVAQALMEQVAAAE